MEKEPPARRLYEALRPSKQCNSDPRVYSDEKPFGSCLWLFTRTRCDISAGTSDQSGLFLPATRGSKVTSWKILPTEMCQVHQIAILAMDGMQVGGGGYPQSRRGRRARGKLECVDCGTIHLRYRCQSNKEVQGVDFLLDRHGQPMTVPWPSS